MDNFDQTALRAELMAVKSGDGTAFERLLGLYRPLVEASVRRFSRTCPDADPAEMRQEATLALFRAAQHFSLENEHVTFGLFAETCIHNALTSRFARKRKSVCSLEELQQSGRWQELTPGEHSGEDSLIEAESLSGLRQSIRAALSELEFAVFIRYAGGEKASSIAEVLDLPRKKVENAQARALVKLRRLLG